MSMVDKLIALATLLVVISVAAERLTEIIKNLVPFLSNEHPDPTLEARRRALIQMLAVFSGLVTAWLASPVIKDVMDSVGGFSTTTIALGLLASGGSALWNSVLEYLLRVKDAAESRSTILSLEAKDENRRFYSTMNGHMSFSECKEWIASEVKPRVRSAVKEWAGRDVSSGDQLGAIAPSNWSEGEQASLIAFVNRHIPEVFDPENVHMKPLDRLLPGETTVLEWENIVWNHQEPRTFCRRVYGL